MTCSWCSGVAITIGRAPTGTVGQTELPCCERHIEVLKKLNYTQVSEADFRKAQRLEAKEAKK